MVRGVLRHPPYWSLVIGKQLFKLTLPRVSAFFFDKVSNIKGLRCVFHLLENKLLHLSHFCVTMIFRKKVIGGYEL